MTRVTSRVSLASPPAAAAVTKVARVTRLEVPENKRVDEQVKWDSFKVVDTLRMLVHTSTRLVKCIQQSRRCIVTAGCL